MLFRSGRPVREYLSVCSKPRNLRMLWFTDGWKRKPPLYGPMALLNCTLYPLFTWTAPLSSIHGTLKETTLSGSVKRSRIPSLRYFSSLASMTSFKESSSEHGGRGLELRQIAVEIGIFRSEPVSYTHLPACPRTPPRSGRRPWRRPSERSFPGLSLIHIFLAHVRDS